MRLHFAPLVLLACGVAAGDEGERTSPTVARIAAEENAKTPAGRRYETALEARLDEWLRKSIEICVKGVPKDRRLDFDVLLRIGGKGEAEDVLLSPETDVGRCVEPDFRREQYPRPPQPSWWTRVVIHLP